MKLEVFTRIEEEEREHKFPLLQPGKTETLNNSEQFVELSFSWSPRSDNHGYSRKKGCSDEAAQKRRMEEENLGIAAEEPEGVAALG